MKKIVTFILMGFILSGCMFRTHKNDIDQGNIYTQADVSRLHHGMSEAQVRAVMGPPVLTNLFSANRMDYVYTYQPGYGQMTEKRVTCYFQNGRLQEIESH